MTEEVLPFDYSNPSSHYGINNFLQAMDKSNTQWQTVTFAACDMADITLAYGLAKHANYMIATQVDVLDTMSTGFNFSFLRSVNDSLTGKEVGHLIASNLLINFKSTKQKFDLLRETPVSLIDLKQLSKSESLHLMVWIKMIFLKRNQMFYYIKKLVETGLVY